MKENKTEKNYLIKERSKKVIEKHGTVKKAIKHLKLELNEYEELWSMYSCDCLGHGITFNRLMISWLERVDGLKKNLTVARS
jgi:hypothetical protein